MNQPLPLPIFILIVVALVSWPLILKYAPKFLGRSMAKADKPSSSLSLIKWAIRDSTTRRRLSISLALIFGLGLAQNIPLPGIRHLDISQLSLAALNLPFSAHYSLLLLGITPFLAACGIIQIGSAFVPALKRWTFASSDSRRNLMRATLVVTFVLTVLQAYSVAVSLENYGLSSFSGFGFIIFIVLTITGSMSLLLFVAYLIQRFGVGNGIALVAVSLTFPQIVIALYRLFSDPTMVSMSIVVLPLSVGLFLTAYHLARRARHIDLTLSGKNQTTIHFPFRPTIIADMPADIASSVLLFPLTLATLLHSEKIQHVGMTIVSGWPHFILFILLVSLAAYVYRFLVFRPKYLHAFIDRFGYESAETGKQPSAQSLNSQMLKTVLITILFIVLVAFIQNSVVPFFDISFSLARILVGWPVIVLGGVSADIISQINFLRDQSISSIENWDVCHVVGDEWEATLKAGYLTTQGIPAMIEPLRFSWGMPTRTIIDEYKIHVPAEYRKEASNLLEERNLGNEIK